MSRLQRRERAQTELGLLLVTELKRLSGPALPYRRARAAGELTHLLGVALKRGLCTTLGQAERALRKALALGIPTWVSPVLPSQTACAAPLELPPPFPRPPVHSPPPSRLVLVHNYLSFHANISRGEEKERKHATVRIKGLGATAPAGGGPADGPVGTAGCFQGNSLEQFWLLPPALGGGCTSRVSILYQLAFSSVPALLSVASAE